MTMALARQSGLVQNPGAQHLFFRLDRMPAAKQPMSCAQCVGECTVGAVVGSETSMVVLMIHECFGLQVIQSVAKAFALSQHWSTIPILSIYIGNI